MARHDPTSQAAALTLQAGEASGALVTSSSGWPFAWSVARILDDTLDAQATPRLAPAAGPDPIPDELLERTRTMLVDLVAHLQEAANHPGWQALLRALLDSTAARTRADIEVGGSSPCRPPPGAARLGRSRDRSGGR